MRCKTTRALFFTRHAAAAAWASTSTEGMHGDECQVRRELGGGCQGLGNRREREGKEGKPTTGQGQSARARALKGGEGAWKEASAGSLGRTHAPRARLIGRTLSNVQFPALVCLPLEPGPWKYPFQEIPPSPARSQHAPTPDPRPWPSSLIHSNGRGDMELLSHPPPLINQPPTTKHFPPLPPGQIKKAPTHRPKPRVAPHHRWNRTRMQPVRPTSAARSSHSPPVRKEGLQRWACNGRSGQQTNGGMGVKEGSACPSLAC